MWQHDGYLLSQQKNKHFIVYYCRKNVRVLNPNDNTHRFKQTKRNGSEFTAVNVSVTTNYLPFKTSHCQLLIHLIPVFFPLILLLPSSFVPCHVTCGSAYVVQRASRLGGNQLHIVEQFWPILRVGRYNKTSALLPWLWNGSSAVVMGWPSLFYWFESLPLEQ